MADLNDAKVCLLDAAFLDAAGVRVLLPRGKIVRIDSPGDSKPDRPSAQSNRFRPCGDIGPVVNRSVVAIRPWRNTIELDEIDAPRGEQCDNGIDVLLCARLGEVDLVVKGIGQRSRKCVALGKRYRYDLLRGVRGAENRVIAVDRRLLDPRNPINSDLLAI